MLSPVTKRSDAYLNKGNRQFSVQAAAELVARLDEIAAAKRWTRSVLIKDILEKFVDGRLVEIPKW
jgi:predicted transcriptional regulator